MTRKSDGTIETITLKDITKHPWLLVVMLLGIGGGSTGAFSVFRIATKDDVAALSASVSSVDRRVSEVAEDLSELKKDMTNIQIEKRAREIAESLKVSKSDKSP